jgi:hypothetical protein
VPHARPQAGLAFGKGDGVKRLFNAVADSTFCLAIPVSDSAILSEMGRFGSWPKLANWWVSRSRRKTEKRLQNLRERLAKVGSLTPLTAFEDYDVSA